MKTILVSIRMLCLLAGLLLSACGPAVSGGQAVSVPPETLADNQSIVRQVQANFAEVAGLSPDLTPQPFQADLVFILERGDRKDVVFQHGEHDCAAGCLDHYYWYFTVWPDGKIEKAGQFQRVRGKNNAYAEEGAPLWGYPR